MAPSRPVRVIGASHVGRVVRVATAGVAVLVALLAPGAASASCLPPVAGEAPWASADVVFLGTVTSLANNDRWATVHVEEVWVGPDQPVDVVVRGGPEGNTATSVDRTYLLGARYVFGVTVVDGQLQDNACSGTTLAEAVDLAAMRPADVRPPTGGGSDTVGAGGGFDLGGLAGPVLLVSVVGGLLLATVLVARRRES
ncbi:MAG: hypothetical protein AB1736_06485 [Chloroflexota bacterium]